MRGTRTVIHLAVAVAAIAPLSASAQAINETFTAGPPPSMSFIPRLTAAGWTFINNSDSPRPQDPVQGGPAWDIGQFLLAPPPSGNPNEYAASDFTASSVAGGTVDDWMILPTRTLRNGDIIRFFTRTADRNPGPDGPERMQVRISPNGASTNVGPTGGSGGDFSIQLLEINPTLLLNGPGSYPIAWTQFELTISGLAAPTLGRIAFRHFVTDSGLDDFGNGGPNGDVVGLDNLEYIPVPEPGSLAFAGLAVTAGIWRRKRQPQ